MKYFIEEYKNISMNDKYNTNNKINIFTYWTGYKCAYIELCLESMKKHLENCNLHILNETNIKNYIPELPKKINKLPVYQQSDIIRVYLLYKYGGVWMDADTILLKDPTKLFDIKNNDYVGFGNSYLSNKCGYPRPSNGVMASRKKGVLISKIKQKIDNKILDISNEEQYPYFSFGKKIIWECIEELQQKNNYKYFHHPSSVDGTRDNNGGWINTKHHISKEFKFKNLLDYSNTYFVMLGNNELSKTPVKKWNKHQLLTGDIFLSEIFRLAFTQLKI